MGQGPSVSDENSRIEYAVGSRKGSNPDMEDAHSTILDLDDSSSTSFFGVYDGHGGANVALYCAKRLHNELVNDEDYLTNLEEAMGRAFSSMDEQMQANDEWRALANPPHVGLKLLDCMKTAPCVKGTPYLEGTTACVVLIKGDQIIVGNVGNTSCVLSRGQEAIVLSTDHMPGNVDERVRILNSDGAVVRVRDTYLIDGIFPLSRSIGDFRFKSNECLLRTQQIVTCTPSIRTEEITDDTKYLLIASSAFWDTISCQSAFNYLRQYSGSYSLASICDKLLNQIKNPVDNLTLMLIYFKPSARLPPTAPPAPMVY
ncbi:probable protein phosphatase 2C 21 [Triticum dicoccoides]|uniref:probable protein phosphatase 2C 21 n=1 Tax=Triticum dicoccoides TaxID=85692 RepID=UPI000E791F20|nr:probable protein phosphatase 2C 21 [Triticum dicoccoides]